MQDLLIRPRYLVTFTVGFDQREIINAAVSKVLKQIPIQSASQLLFWAKAEAHAFLFSLLVLKELDNCAFPL